MTSVMNRSLARRGYSLLEWALTLGIVACVVVYVLATGGAGGRGHG